MTTDQKPAPFYKTFPESNDEQPKGFTLLIWDKNAEWLKKNNGNAWSFFCPGQKRQDWELKAGKLPLFCDKYAFQRCKKIMSKKFSVIHTAVIVHNSTNRKYMKYLMKNGYLKTEELFTLRWYPVGQYTTYFISKPI